MKRIAVLLLLPLIPSSAFGWGDGFGGGSISWVPWLEERAELMEKSFDELSERDLAIQLWAKTLCDNHPCQGLIEDKEISEEEAKELLESYMARKAEWFSALIAWIGLGLSALSLLISVLAYRQSNANERDIGVLQGTALAKNGDST